MSPTPIDILARDDDEIALERLAALIRRIDPIPASVTVAARGVLVPDAGIDVSKTRRLASVPPMQHPRTRREP